MNKQEFDKQVADYMERNQVTRREAEQAVKKNMKPADIFWMNKRK